MKFEVEQKNKEVIAYVKNNYYHKASACFLIKKKKNLS